MTIEVRGQEFKIDFVNNFCREQYQQMLEAAEELTEIPERIAAVDGVDVAAAKAEFRKLRAEQKELVQRIGALREEILRELVETNGYDYDRNWWLHKTDTNDINRFVVECIRKDLKDEGSKKK